MAAFSKAAAGTPRGYLRSSSCRTSPAARRSDAVCRAERPGTRQHVASCELVLLDAGQVGGDPAAGRGGFDLPVVLLQAPDPHHPASRDDLELLAHGQDAVDERPCYDCAE